MSTAPIQPLTDTSAAALTTALDTLKAAIVIGERSVKNDNGSVTTPLLYPVQNEAQPLTSITMRRATGKDLKRVDGLTGINNVLTLIGALGALPPTTVDQLDAEDIGELGEVIEHFLPKGRQTGDAKS